MEVDRRLLPITAGVNKQDHLTLGGCDTKELASEYGTPLYVYDEDTLRHMCREFIGEFTQRYSKTKVLYAAKAFINPVLVKIVRQEGLGMDPPGRRRKGLILDAEQRLFPIWGRSFLIDPRFDCHAF